MFMPIIFAEISYSGVNFPKLHILVDGKVAKKVAKESQLNVYMCDSNFGLGTWSETGLNHSIPSAMWGQNVSG